MVINLLDRFPVTIPLAVIFAPYRFLWDELVNLRWDDFTPKVEENRGKKETIKQVDNHAWDAWKYFLLSLPEQSIKPTPRSKDSAVPLAGELLNSEVN